jgi:hypothetical protein
MAPNGSGPIPALAGWTRYESEDLLVATIHNSSRAATGWWNDVPGTEPTTFSSGGATAGGLNKNGSNVTTDVSGIGPLVNWDTLPRGTAANTDTLAYVKFTVTVPEAGEYRVNIIYNGNDDKSILVKLNDNPSRILSLPSIGGLGWDSVFTRQLILGPFTAGENTIWVSGTRFEGWANIDCIDIRNVREP